MIVKKVLPLFFPLLAFIIFFTDTNTLAFHAINASGVAFPDLLWTFLTTLGNKKFALVLLFLFLWRKPDLLVAVLIASVLAGIISSTLKPLFDAARPTDVLELSMYHLIGPKISGHSYPSGHTLTAFTIAATVIFFMKMRWVTLGMMVLASLAGLSRIMLGVHWPIDVLMGATLGLACGYAGVQFAQLNFFQKAKYKQIIVTILFVFIAIKLLWKGTSYANVQGAVWIVGVAGLVLGLVLLYKFMQQPAKPSSV